MPFKPRIRNLFSHFCRTDKTSPLVNKSQPRGPGNYFTWNWALFPTWLVEAKRGYFQPSVAARCQGPAVSSAEPLSFCTWGFSVLYLAVPSPSADGGGADGPFGGDLEVCAGGGHICLYNTGGRHICLCDTCTLYQGCLEITRFFDPWG